MEENQELRTVPFVTEDGEQVEMYVLEETTLQGIHYILVTEDLSDDSEEAVVMIMKEENSRMRMNLHYMIWLRMRMSFRQWQRCLPS